MEETESFDAALEWAGAGDLIIMLSLGRSAQITEKLEEAASLK